MTEMLIRYVNSLGQISLVHSLLQAIIANIPANFAIIQVHYNILLKIAKGKIGATAFFNIVT